MLETTNYYKAFGFIIKSSIPLPELKRISSPADTFDIEIEIGSLTETWNSVSTPSNQFFVSEQQIMFHLANIAIYCIENGNKIIVSPMEGIEESQLRLYILGSCMGAILMQRQVFPLHGSAIAIDGRAYAIVGHSGAGKSTLASAFLEKGFDLLTDDIIPLSFSKESGRPYVIPTYPQQKLWQESLTHFGQDSSNYKPLVNRKTKFAVPVTSQFSDKQLPLAGIFELVKTKEDHITLMPIQRMDLLQTVFNHTYRNNFIEGMNLREWHFHSAVKVINHVDVYQLRRPGLQFTVGELADCVLGEIGGGEVIAN